MMKLIEKRVEKPWGAGQLPPRFARPDDDRVGEIWFQAPDGSDLPLLVKYIFTSEKLSIQVHPDDAQAMARGHARGKEECWYILDCAPGAVIGLGLKQALTPEALRTAALDGTLENLMDWRPIRPGDFFFIPAGTIHAIGAGITVAEIQQNLDVTYRLYDYGRPRELHLDDGVDVSRPDIYGLPAMNAPLGENRTLLPGDAAPFSVKLLQQSAGDLLTLGDVGMTWFLPLEGAGKIGGEIWSPGECWLIDNPTPIAIDRSTQALVATAQL